MSKTDQVVRKYDVYEQHPFEHNRILLPSPLSPQSLDVAVLET